MFDIALFSFVSIWGLVIYHHLIYPLILKHSIRRARQRTPEIPTQYNWPAMTLLIPAYNEADVIADKIRNIAMLDYPADRLHLVIACDGCSDDTAHIVRQTLREPEIQYLQAELLEFHENRGKTALLNAIIPTLNSELIGLSDASALISMDGLKLAAMHLSRPEVGVVAATYRILNPGSQGEARYWRYQVDVKRGEGALGSPIGVHGALYFIRKGLFSPLDADVINDDFILPMQVVSQGYRAVYEESLISLELEQASMTQDQNRRKRIAAGNIQQLLRLPGLLSPRLGGTAFAFASGKGLRAVMPLLLLLQLIACLLMSGGSEAALLFALLQIVTIVLARIRASLEQVQLPSAIDTLCYLVDGYSSSLIGVLRYLLGLEKGRWQRVNSVKEN